MERGLFFCSLDDEKIAFLRAVSWVVFRWHPSYVSLREKKASACGEREAGFAPVKTAGIRNIGEGILQRIRNALAYCKR